MSEQRYAGRAVTAVQYFLSVLMLFTLYRIILLLAAGAETASTGHLLFNGLRFDLRWTAIISFPFLLLLLISSFWRSGFIVLLMRLYVRFILVLLLLLFTVDYFYFQYTGSRLSPALLSLLTPLSVAVKTVWQGYPVLWLMVLVAILYMVLYRFVFKRIIHYNTDKEPPVRLSLFFLLFTVLMILTVWGTFKKYPLTWSDAFDNNTEGILALNPAESFSYSLVYNDNEVAEAPTEDDLQLIQQQVQYDSTRAVALAALKQQLNLNRGEQLNIVVILAESLCSYKTSLTGNPLNPTPFLKELQNKSYYFSRCFTPHFGTARAVWNLFTGVPDVNWTNLATHQLQQKPLPVLLNQISFGKKYYMLGGDGTWADIKGFLHRSVNNLQLLEQNDFNEKASSAWGIDDYDLLMRADSLLRNTDTNFFAVIQTASNHTPFIIPASAYERGFTSTQVNKKQLYDYGFTSGKDFNSVKYLDFCLKSYFNKASSSSYFSKTLFVVVGDHGVAGNAGHIMNKDWDRFKLKVVHVPLLFYSPSAKWSYTDSSLCSLQDIIPTVAGFVQQPAVSSVNGIDLFSGSYKKGQFYMLHELNQAGWLSHSARYLSFFDEGKFKTADCSYGFNADSLRKLTVAAYKTYRYRKTNHQ